MSLTPEQKDTKIVFLEQENARLRSQLLDAQIISGQIRLSDRQDDDSSSDGGGDGEQDPA